jgi:hypothetical protein
MSIDAVIARMREQLDELERRADARTWFHQTYLRTTSAVAEEIARSGFTDNDWVEKWDVVFADLYLDALDASLRGDDVPAPWRVAFDAAASQPERPPLQHVLLGMNAHINYDLAQALVAVITPAEFDDAAVLQRRELDHRHIDDVLAARVAAEDDVLAASGQRTFTDRVLAPFNRLGTQRFLRESRRKVWANARALDRARKQGDDTYLSRLGELEQLAGARVADLLAPGPVLLKLAVRGFGVQLPATAS